jgi:hypothetical protein
MKRAANAVPLWSLNPFAASCVVTLIQEHGVEGTKMKIIAAAAILSLVAAGGFAGPAQAKGCLKGAAVGGVAGHMVNHGALGAGAGCVVGHHEANKHAAEQARTENGDNARAPADNR